MTIANANSSMVHEYNNPDAAPMHEIERMERNNNV